MDLGKAFIESASLFKKQKLLFVPRLILSLFFIWLTISFIFLSGTGDFFREIRAEEPNIESLKPLLNPGNVVLFLITFFLGVMGAIYFSSLSFALIARSMKGKAFTVGELLRLNNSFFLRYFLLNVIITALLIIPILVPIGLTIIAFFVSTPIGVTLAVITFCLVLAYWFLLGARFLFIEPILYLENVSVIDSFKKSYSYTSKKVGWALLLLLVIGGGSYLVGLVAQPIYNTIFDVLLLGNISSMLSLLFLPFFLVLQAAAATFLNAVLFCSLEEFKGG
ncbi:MAG: hypothetical protein A2730_03900 [Candidatus Staskawiczbacteria bacterium RIFCSPHIGHO2_01_FULL_39_25]|uniref:Glycerophosphoryl diester phosphodiesterase membrane domain-containing protein n=1 Tax=Candidatus Staskawiczbacteria bacterium RIFCSPHIGHO2_01_FULL_39_25 TaxID=1802202 RepID=A0A1G2HQ70_9BACT|nr:hypothetical protein [Candidatus Woesearchaeota archaeon]OGZ64390.1 MAG: hypothetical protein A2730_03900 [Candidatus Staskawiczbacteria bacterium RIFCSPHIGHO2_01_FULL_39_25]